MKEEKDNKEVVSETKEEVVKEVPKKEDVLVATDTTKELEELRKFKAEVEAQRKEEESSKQSQQEVAVSKSFFSGDEKSFREKTKSNTEKNWEELFKEGVPRRYEN